MHVIVIANQSVEFFPVGSVLLNASNQLGAQTEFLRAIETGIIDRVTLEGLLGTNQVVHGHRAENVHEQ